MIGSGLVFSRIWETGDPLLLCHVMDAMYLEKPRTAGAAGVICTVEI